MRHGLPLLLANAAPCRLFADLIAYDKICYQKQAVTRSAVGGELALVEATVVSYVCLELWYFR